MSDGIKKIWKKAKPMTPNEKERDRNDKINQQFMDEMKERYEKNRRDAREQLSGKELEDVLHRLDEMESQDRQEYEARDNPQEMKRILERRLKEHHERRRRIETQVKGQERETALKKMDEYQTSLQNRIDELKIYENPPDHFPEKPGINDLMKMQKMLKSGTHEEKQGVLQKMNRRRIQGDALKRTIQEKLKSPVYQQEVISEYKRRTLKFNTLTVFLLVLGIGCMTFLYHLHTNDSIFLKLLCFLIAGAFVAIYSYLGRKLWRCPACDCELDIMTKYKGPGKNPYACRQCGAPFR